MIRGNRKNGLKKLLILLLMTVLFILPVLTGCSTERLDGQVAEKAAEQTAVAATETKETVPEETEQAEEPEQAEQSEETADEDEYIDVADVEDEKIDYSKYQDGEIVQEKAASGESDSGLVSYSTGEQTVQDEYGTEPVPEGMQNPVEPENVTIDTSKTNTCYLSISCATILNNMEALTEGKEMVVPADGVIYPQTEVTFYEGESVFDVLLRETQNNRIHMEYSFNPGFNSNYVEGIGNLYEFDCGSGSGWMFRVNGWYPNYGASRYVVQPGDVIEWNYTCDLGDDIQ